MGGKREISLKIRKIHRYLGVFIGLQFLAWTVSGLYFSWTDIDEIHGDQFKRESVPKKSLYSNLISFDSIPVNVGKLNLVSIDNQPYYWINEQLLYDALDGTLKKNISEKEAISVAKQNLIEGLKVDHVELLKTTDSHHEYRGQKLPVYAIHYDHPDLLVAYVDAKSGIFKKIRHESWRWFDFLWMGHTMDYNGRDNFNNLLLRIFSLFGLFTVISGFLLWGTSSPTLKRILK
ncbi:hypothetical protein DEJ39_03505 [Bacteroidetes bacterium SCGC AAA795-G10]|nr:hypothetical protein DEJ39_03505 [Bacteroidetes bacterium SCGC AAA795-G10]